LATDGASWIGRRAFVCGAQGVAAVSARGVVGIWVDCANSKAQYRRSNEVPALSYIGWKIDFD
jgi:hypothetical protein